ncbi:MAG: DUF554 family protein [Actinobacteria bacterium]|nr:DUF554 family protein [Actinomycetota bacterium]MSW11813.1 DUF554 family protein [Actinomycetota bacterium]MSY17119.1 DUF554 family protein [Actinomycetota bacterium]MSY98493.1 DUF554 family protein [Actinomycetota bacterium]
MRGSGTILNMVAILIGSGLGVLIGHRLPQRTRDTVTDALGLVTLVIGALSIVALTSTAFSDSVGTAAPLLIVLGALLIGGIIGSLLQIELRLEQAGSWLQRKLIRKSSGDSDDKRKRFVEGFVDASLVFCIGPLAILGALNDGLGLGIEQLALKSTLDGFASLAFAASLGWGVALSALSVGIVQGAFTIVGALVGSVLSAALIDAITATGGVLLIGVGLRLLKIKSVPVGDMLPALVVAPLLAAFVALFMGN